MTQKRLVFKKIGYVYGTGNIRWINQPNVVRIIFTAHPSHNANDIETNSYRIYYDFIVGLRNTKVSNLNAARQNRAATVKKGAFGFWKPYYKVVETAQTQNLLHVFKPQRFR